MKDYLNWSHKRILQERLKISIYANSDLEYRELLKRQCELDPLFFFLFFAWTYNPQKKQPDLPFILYPFQRKLIYWLEDRLEKNEIGLIEKSRQMGCTWVIMTYLFYKWLFAENYTAIVGSRKEEICDRRDSQVTLFYKLDYQLRRIPKWLLPKRFSSRDRRHLILTNPEKQNVIIGESSNPNYARGATANQIYMDEFSTWPDAAASWTSASRAANCRICASTPLPACYFKTLRFSEQMKKNNRVKTLHWSQHPLYDRKWYEKQKETMSPEMLSQEVDLSYDVSGRGRVYEEFDMCPIANYHYNPKLPLYVAWDYGRDQTALIWAQKDLAKKLIYIIDTYHNSEKLIDFYIPFVTGKIPRNKEHLYTNEEKRQIISHKRWKKARHFGDPAGRQKSVVSNLSALKILHRAGIYVFTNDRANSFVARRDATKLLLRQLCVDEHNTYFIEAIQQARYPQRKETSQATSPILRPVHDHTSHFRSALEYLSVNLKIEGGPPRRINYLEHQPKMDEGGKLHEDQEKKEKKAKIVRYSFRSYSK